MRPRSRFCALRLVGGVGPEVGAHHQVFEEAVVGRLVLNAKAQLRQLLDSRLVDGTVGQVLDRLKKQGEEKAVRVLLGSGVGGRRLQQLQERVGLVGKHAPLQQRQQTGEAALLLHEERSRLVRSARAAVDQQFPIVHIDPVEDGFTLGAARGVDQHELILELLLEDGGVDGHEVCLVLLVDLQELLGVTQVLLKEHKATQLANEVVTAGDHR